VIFTVWNETEPYDHRTTIGETVRYALNSTPYASWTPGMTFLEVSWSEHGYNPYEKSEIFGEDPTLVAINGCTGWTYETEQNRLIVWTAGNATYWVHGSLDREELLRVARSISIQGMRTHIRTTLQPIPVLNKSNISGLFGNDVRHDSRIKRNGFIAPIPPIVRWIRSTSS